MQVVILAGGLGTRLGALTSNMPKPMVRVAGTPYLEHQLRLLREQDLCNIVILTGYRGEQIEEYFGDGSWLGLSIRYSREPRPLGTGGALKFAEPFLDSSFLVIYGDSYLPIDYRQVAARLSSSSALGLVVVYRDTHGQTTVPMNIAIDVDGIVSRYEKDCSRAAEDLLYVDAGVVAFRHPVLDLVAPERPVSLEQEVFPKLIARRGLQAFHTDQRFFDLGTPERLQTLEAYLV